MHNGDYETAAQTYRDLLALKPEIEVDVQARLGLGTAYLRDEDYPNAVKALESLLEAHPDGELASRGRFLMAEALVGVGEPLTATEEYRAYLAAGTVITSYINEYIGNALYAGAAYTEAIDAYTAAVAGAPDRSFEVGMREKLALTHVALGDYAAAVAQYDAILDVARIRTYRARIAYQAAETLVQAGEIDAGYDRHLDVVETYYTDHSPYAEYYPYLSLVRLVEAGRPADDLLRGIVDYYGGAYGPAVAAFSRYVNASESYDSAALWYAGLSYLGAGNPDLAAYQFRVLIDDYPESRYWGDSWMGLAEAAADAGDVDAAVQTYREFVVASPDHRRAPEALFEAAKLLERDGRLEDAAGAYMDCHVQYPDSEFGPQALFRNGLQTYQLEKWVDTAVAWDTLVNVYSDSLYLPAAFLWLGKTRLAQGDKDAADAAFREAVTADPDGYYGLRAADLQADPLVALFPPTRYERASDEVSERIEAEAWLAEWLGLEDATGLGQLGSDLAADPRLQRGLELWRLGHFEEAKWELEAMRYATQDDALAQYQLALLFRDIGLYRSSIICAARLVALSPVEAFLDAPSFIARLTHPTYYEDLALENARHSGLDMLLIFALIRQESLFESLATSTASAHGLMQVIPPTGEQIAVELGWPPGYDTADLYRPYVSLRFGTYYLAQQRDRFDDRIDVALAAYNGGPSRADRWLEAAGDDPDLFLELITIQEPRIYIKRIKEHLAVYRALYGDG
jgi:soluble lytic murein transglycosylase